MNGMELIAGEPEPIAAANPAPRLTTTRANQRYHETSETTEPHACSSIV
jgi:hypothetical protein